MSAGIVIEYSCNGNRRHIVHLCAAGDTAEECVQAAAAALTAALADCNEGEAGQMPACTRGDYNDDWVNGGGKKVCVSSTGGTQQAHDDLVAAAKQEWPEGPSGT